MFEVCIFSVVTCHCHMCKHYTADRSALMLLVCICNVIISVMQKRQIINMRWQDHNLNTEVTSLDGLGPVQLDSVIRWRIRSLAIYRLDEQTPAPQALRCHIDFQL